MTREEFLCDYWAYYLMLERKFMHTLDYVSLHTDNESAYSNEYAALIQMIGSEIDSFFKVYCGFGASDIKSITEYCCSVTTDYPGILTQKVSVRAAKMTFKPFEGWDREKARQSLFWWNAFDNIKHSRTTNKKDASQKTVLYALAALFLLEMKYLKKIATQNNEMDIPDEKSQLFSLPGWTFNFKRSSELVIKAKHGIPIIDGGDESDK